MPEISKTVQPGNLQNYLGQYEHLRQTLEQSDDMVYIIDAINQKPIFSSKTLLNVLGYSPEEIEKLGPVWAKQITHPDDYEDLSIYFHNYQTYTPGALSRIVYRMKDSQGNWRTLESIDTSISVGPNGYASFIFGLTRDITQTSPNNILTLSHRCKHCNKLLGLENMKNFEFSIKCTRCGDINTVQSSMLHQ